MRAPAIEYIEFRQRRPLNADEHDAARRERELAIDDAGCGAVIDIEVLADLLGRQMATPVAIPGSDKVRPAAYRMGCEAILLAIATRFGLDVEPFVALMDRSRSEEASKVGAP